MTAVLRVARPVADLDRSVDFYCGVLGWAELFRSSGREDLGEMQIAGVGPASASWHLELLASGQRSLAPSPTEHDLLVVFVDPDEVQRIEQRVIDAGLDPIVPTNPWWRVDTCTFADPDGYLVAYSSRWS